MIGRLLVVAAAVALTGWSLFAFVWRPVHCNAEVSRIEADTLNAERLSDPYAKLVRARRNLQRLAALRCATEVRVPVLLAANEELVGRLEDAAKHYEQAVALEPRPEIYMALGNVQVQLGRVDAAVESYARALKFHPTFIDKIPSEELRRLIAARQRQPQ